MPAPATITTTARAEFDAAFAAAREFKQWAANSPEATEEAIQDEACSIAAMPYGYEALNMAHNRPVPHTRERTPTEWAQFADDLAERFQFAANS